MVSEQVPIVLDGASPSVPSSTIYQFQAVVAMTDEWDDGAQIVLTFYNSASQVISSTDYARKYPMAAGTEYTITTNAVAAPAETSYAVARIEINTEAGPAPITDNLLKVYSAEVQNTNNPALPPVLNSTTSFSQGLGKWTSETDAILDYVVDNFTAVDGAVNSLVIADSIELLGAPNCGANGNQSTVAELVDATTGEGACFRISAPGGYISSGVSTQGYYDLGDPQPTQDIVESMLLDGERPFGRRSSNRTLSIPVQIFARSLKTLAAAKDYLLSQIDQDTFQITWTPSSTGLPVVFDCFRAQPSVTTYGFNNDREAGDGSAYAMALVTINIQALPYLRSGNDGVQSLTFENGLVDGSAQKEAIQIDSFFNVNSMLPYTDNGKTYDNGGWRKNTAQKPGSGALIGPASAEYMPPNPPWYPWPDAIYSNDNIKVDLTGLYTIGFWFGQSFDTAQWGKDPKFVSNCKFNVTLTDNFGRNLSFNVHNGAAQKCKWGSDPNKPVWTWIPVNFPQNRYAFNYSYVAGYTIRVSNWGNGQTTGFVKLKAWLNGFSAYPGTVSWADEPRSSVYSFPGLTGMARSPISAQIELPAQAPQTIEITKSGTWLVPAGVTSVYAENWGGGGGGASVNVKALGAGGGGGEYAADTVSVIPGTKVPVSIGAGGYGGETSPTVELFTAAGIHPWVCPDGVTQAEIETWGAGAAGAAGGGGGGGGQYSRNPTATLTPGKTYYVSVGAAGKPNTGTSSAQNAARNGGDSWFNGRNAIPAASDTGMVYAHGGWSTTTGSSTGGGPGYHAVNAGVTRYSGGYGGGSPGNPGGGGGGSGWLSGNGAKGGNGGTGKNTAGGYGGGTTTANAGAGGKGANNPGNATAGAQPGGGGGGGYSSNGNHTGAAGGAGMVRITYVHNLGNQVNGGATTFGDQGNLTNLNVVAHGGTTPADNATLGAAGGTGSTNALHRDGGRGGILGSSNERALSYNDSRVVSTYFTNMAATITATGTSFSVTATSALDLGCTSVYVQTNRALDPGTTITDSAGNVYLQSGSQQLGGTSAGWLYVFNTSVQFPITTSTVLTMDTQSASTTFLAQWVGSQYFQMILNDQATGANGNGTSASVSQVMRPPGETIFSVILGANDNTQAFTGSGLRMTGTSLTNGAMSMRYDARPVAGSASAISQGFTIPSASNWAVLQIPYMSINQQTAALIAGGANTTTAATTIAMPVQIPMDAGQGVLVVSVMQTTGTVTINSVTDNATGGSNTYTRYGTAGSRVFVTPVTNPLTAANTITATFATATTASMAAWFIPGGIAVDGVGGATGSGTTASSAWNAPGYPGDTALEIFSATGNVSVTNGDASYYSAGGAGSAGLTTYNPTIQAFFKYLPDTTTPAASSATLSASATWYANNVTIRMQPFSGAGGSAGGPNAKGYAGIGGSGGPGWPGGGKGAPGATVADAAGNDAAAPGGGASGANSSSATAEQGGTGGSGMVRLTWQPPLSPFNDLILHRPGIDSTARSLNPVVSVGPYDPPDNREYTVSSLVQEQNAQFGGTYSVLLINHAWASSSTSRRITVTVNQYEYKNGPVVSCSATKVLTPNTDIVNGYVTMGELTLPIKDYDQSVSETYYTVSVQSTNQNDRFQDLVFLDTMGQTVLVNVGPGTAGDGRYSTYYVDEPDFDKALGRIMGSSSERDRAISVMDMALATGGPLYVDDGDNMLMVYSTSGAPNLGVTYSPRWFTDRMS